MPNNNAALGSYPYKGLIHAPRIKGDLDPGLEYGRIQGDLRAAWAKSDFPGGLLPGGVEQDIFHESETQNYRIGTRRIEYGRTFRYSQAGGDLKTLANFARLVINANLTGATAVFTGGWEGTPGLNADAPAGQSYVDILDLDARVVNFYQGGYFIHFAAGKFHQFFIVASRVALDADNLVRLYLDHPIYGENLLAAAGVSAFRSPYSNIQEAGSVAAGWEPFVGLSLNFVQNGYWFWLQTGGPAWITPTASGGVDDWPGASLNNRDVYAQTDGTILPQSDAEDARGKQRIGYTLLSTRTGEGDAFIMMQLDTT